jgi:hypothetical protein
VPIQAMPAITCAQRRSAFSHSMRTADIGEWGLGIGD